ncbi:hypothetical protein NQ314_009763, partial [Rhamnusium bicolor]
AIIAFFVVLAVANASVLHGASVLQGPSSRTTLVGPEGSVISSVSPGGQVITEEHPGVVAHAAPVAYASYAAPAVSAYAAPLRVAHSAYAAPSLVAHSAYATPVVSAYSSPIVSRAAYAAPYSYSVAAPVVAAHGSVDTVVAGPSGTIATSRGLTTADVVGSHGVYAHGW